MYLYLGYVFYIAYVGVVQVSKPTRSDEEVRRKATRSDDLRRRTTPPTLLPSRGPSKY